MSASAKPELPGWSRLIGHWTIEGAHPLLPGDEKIDPTRLPFVRPDELGKRGRSELVRVIFPLTHLSAPEAIPDVRKLLGTFGTAEALEKANQLLLCDTAGNLRRVQELIQQLEEREAGKKAGPKAK